MNAPIKPINAAHEALLSNTDALCVDAVAAATGLNKRDAAKQIKQLAGLGLIEPAHSFGMPFYRLISAPAAPAAPAPSERVLTPEAQAERDQFDLEVADRGCTCFISPPCGYCTHPGNPRNQEEDETAWMTVSDSEGGEAADADGWIPWVATADSVCPVPDGTRVRVKLNNGTETAENSDDLAENIIWHELSTASVVAYKIIAQAQAVPLTETQREEFTLLGVIADIRKAIGDEGRIMLGDLAGEIGSIVKARNDFFDDFKRITKVCEPLTELVPHDSFNIAEAVQIALQRLKDAAALQKERDELRTRLDAVTQQSIADTDALTAQIEHLRAELETARAEAIALRPWKAPCPASAPSTTPILTAELQALRTSNANAINEADRLRAELAERDSHLHKITGDTGRSDLAQRLIDHNDERLYHEADVLMHEASDAITKLERERDRLSFALACEGLARQALEKQAANKPAPSGYLVCATKRKPRRINDGERAKVAALAAVRAGAARAEVLAVVPVGTARRGAEWRAK